jgi:hypothetical protein
VASWREFCAVSGADSMACENLPQCNSAALV